MLDFTVVARAGLTQAEFASLVGVTRATACLWVRGKMNPNRYIKDHVAAVVASLERAIAAGQLPLPHSTPKTRRVERLCAAVRDCRTASSQQ